jgi:hypothetical protein
MVHLQEAPKVAQPEKPAPDGLVGTATQHFDIDGGRQVEQRPRYRWDRHGPEHGDLAPVQSPAVDSHPVEAVLATGGDVNGGVTPGGDRPSKRSQSRPAVRCEATASGPAASTAPKTAISHVGCTPGSRYTPWRTLVRRRPARAQDRPLRPSPNPPSWSAVISPRWRRLTRSIRPIRGSAPQPSFGVRDDRAVLPRDSTSSHLSVSTSIL